MLVYLKEFHRDDITNLLNDSNDCLHVSLNVSLEHLQRNRPELHAEVLRNVWSIIPKWDRALLEAQKELVEGNCFLEDDYQVKENCHVRFINLPQYPTLRRSFPGTHNTREFVKVKGNVVRISQGRLLEFKREYRCTRCKETYVVEAQYHKMYALDAPKKCLNGSCNGNLQPKNTNPKPEFYMDYQQIRIQELFSDKYMPASLLVTLDNDLVDYCVPGDCVTICGTVEIRWSQICRGKISKVDLSLRAVSVLKDEEKINSGKDLSEQLVWVLAQWQDTVENVGQFEARDTIIRSICPEIHGMYLVKLAMALAMCGGVQCSLDAGAKRRGSSHLLLVGDPGLAKSKLLIEASKISARSVLTTGMGCSAAGLTAAAIKNEGEWQLEAGALVLADGGVCCIDEFNLMSQNDKASIHEAMEQQTISMAKAGLVCKLKSRCSVIAAMNPKNLHNMTDDEELSHINIGIGTPLLSRFDVILVLRDEHNGKLDNRLSDHIIQNANDNAISADIWDLERLQSHFLAVQKIKPVLTNEALLILGSYYQHCRSDSMRDSSRSSVRLLDSLHRLAQAHARLMCRDKVDAVDAIVVIRLMEGSWGFGRLLDSIDVLRENLPLGPNENQVQEITTRLGLESLNPAIMQSLKEFNLSKRDSRNKSGEDQDKSPIIGHLQSLFGFNKDNIKKLTTEQSPEKAHESVIESTPEESRKENISILNEFPSEVKLTPNRSTSKWCIEIRNSQLQNSVFRKNSLIESTVLDDVLDMDIFDSLEMTDQRVSKRLADRQTSVTKSSNTSKSSDLVDKVPKESSSDPSASRIDPSNSLSVTSRNSLFNSTILDDSLDMDLFNSLETVESQKTPKDGQGNISEIITCPENIITENRAKKLQDSRSPLKLIKSKSLTFQRTNPLDLNDEDLEDAGLDIDINFTPKTCISLNQEIENRPIIVDYPLPETSMHQSNSKRKIVDKRSHKIEESTSLNSSPKPEPNKKIRLASQTLAKLNKFVNPKLVEVDTNTSPVRDINSMAGGNKSPQKETEDSAYSDTMTIITPPNRFTGQCDSRFSASLDDDLECLNFDL